MRLKQRPVACETGNRCSSIIPCLPPHQCPGQWSQWPRLLHFSLECTLFLSRGKREGVERVSFPECFPGIEISPSGQVGGKSHIQISIWSKEPTKSHSTAKAFKTFLGKEFQPFLRNLTHYILKAYSGNHVRVWSRRTLIISDHLLCALCGGWWFCTLGTEICMSLIV